MQYTLSRFIPRRINLHVGYTAHDQFLPFCHMEYTQLITTRFLKQGNLISIKTIKIWK
jgi:hypothetical protein